VPWPVPTNSCPENKKKPNKIKNSKIKKKKNILTNQPPQTSPIVSSYNFFLTKTARLHHLRFEPAVRPGAVGLFTGVEYSRVRDIAWMYLTSLETTCIVVGRVDVKKTARLRWSRTLVVLG